MHHAEPTEPIHLQCQNCGTALTGPYCSQCGQKDFDFHRSFKSVFHEIVETWFHVDHSFLHGFYDLLFRPGRMTVDFNAGRRARHVPPFRFYLVVSLLFFVVVTPRDFHSGGGTKFPVRATEEAKKRTGKEIREPDELRPEDIRISLPFFSESQEKRIQENVIEKIRHPEEATAEYFHALPKALLICLPAFAFFTWVLFFKKRFTYLQHLVLSVHLHSFVFLWFVVALGWYDLLDLISSTGAICLGFAAFLYAVGHYFVTLKRALNTGTVAAGILGTLAGMIYFVFLTLTLALTLTLTLIA